MQSSVNNLFITLQKIIVFMVLGGLLLVVLWDSGESVKVHVPEGYYDRVDNLIQNGVIVADTAQSSPSQGGQLYLAVDSSNINESDRLFVRKSFIKSDIELHNTAVGSGELSNIFNTYRKKDGVTYIAHYRSSRNRKTPLVGKHRWQGDIVFRGISYNHILWNENNPVYIQKSTWRENGSAYPDSKDHVDVPIDGFGVTVSPAVDLIWRGPDNLLATVFSLGEDVVIQRGRYIRGEVFLNGMELKQGQKMRLDNGDLISLVVKVHGRDTNFTYQYYSPDNKGVKRYALRSLVLNGQMRRSVTGYMPWMMQLADAVEYLYMNNRFNIPVDYDVMLTIDQDLQLSTQKVLSTYVSGRENVNRPLYRGAINIEDPLSGEILALASFVDSGFYDRRTGRNSNFVRFPVGSAVKPLWAAAALSVNPELANLSIAAHDSCNSILGVEFSPAIEDFRHGKVIGIADFLERSCNVYAMALGLCALTSEGDTSAHNLFHGISLGDRLSGGINCWIGNQPISKGVNLEHYIRPIPQNQQQSPYLAAANLDHSNLALMMNKYFDINLRAETAETNPRSEYDFSIWRFLINDLVVNRNQDYFISAFQGLTPSKTNIRWDIARNFRGTIMSSWLGDADFRSSPLLFTTAFSRVITNRKIEPFIVRRQSPERNEFEDLGLDSSVVGIIREGCTRVITGQHGTARNTLKRITDSLKVLVERETGNLKLEIYAKTGTPMSSEIARKLPGSYRLSSTFVFLCVLVDNETGVWRYAKSGGIYLDSAPIGEATRIAKELLPFLVESLLEEWRVAS